MTDHLHFSQGFIGALSAVSAVGWVAGGLLYRWLLRWDAHAGAAAIVDRARHAGRRWPTCCMVDPISAVVVYFLSGVAGMIANVATLTLAAEHCPARAEGFAFAAMMSVINLATPLADTSGAFLYEHVFNGHLAPLIVVSAAFTAFVLVLIPLFGIERSNLLPHARERSRRSSARRVRVIGSARSICAASFVAPQHRSACRPDRPHPRRCAP